MHGRETGVLVVCGLAFEAAIAGGPGVTAIHGPGAASIARLDAALAGGRGWRGILSFGIAGGLDPELRAGDCVLADVVINGEERFGVDDRWLLSLRANLPGAVVGAVAGVSSPATDPRAKASLRRRGDACAVDMESHHAALAAQRHGLPFAAVRIVADPAHRGIPACAIAAMRPDGRAALMPLLRALAANPAELATLAAVVADTFIARRHLATVRRRAGEGFGAP